MQLPCSLDYSWVVSLLQFSRCGWSCHGLTQTRIWAPSLRKDIWLTIYFGVTPLTSKFRRLARKLATLSKAHLRSGISAKRYGTWPYGAAAYIKNKHCEGFLLRVSTSSFAPWYVVGQQTSVEKPSKICPPRLSTYGTYKAVSGNAPQSMTVNTLKSLAVPIRGKKVENNNAGLSRFETTVLSAHPARMSLRYQGHEHRRESSCFSAFR